MSTTSGRVRPRRSAGHTVAVTGAAGGAYGLGPALVSRLAGAESVRRVVAIDVERGDVAGLGVTWRIADVCDPLLASRLSGVVTVVHLAQDTSLTSDARGRHAYNVRAAQTVLTAAAAAGVKRVVLVSSAMVYGARADNPVPLPEDSPLRADPDTGLAGDFLEIEHLAERAPRAHPGLSVTVVRPAALVGPDVDSVITRHFESPRLLAVKGALPCWQFCHVDDLVDALHLAAIGRVRGAVAVGCAGWLDHERVEALTGRRRFELPAALTFGTAERLHRIGVTPAPAGELHYIAYPWVVDPASLREAGWEASYDNEAALKELLAQIDGRHAVVARRLDRKDATITAAGATAAALGTAAIVRHARRRRHG